MESLARVENLYRYYGDICAVHDVSFEIKRGEVLGFLGPNGAGKSTTMQIISGNLAPSAGLVQINGIDMLDHPPLYRELTVDEYLGYCAQINRVPGGKRRAAVDTARQRCGLTEVGRRLIGNLSKGFQQRVGIAQAIIHSPALVILDEPTVGLDPIQIREIRALIRELGKTHGVILSTHILPEVQAVCDHVQIIHKGALVLHERIEGLARRVKSATLAVAFRAAPDPALIERLPGVHNLENDRAGRLRVFHEPGQDPAEAIVRLAAEKCWGIYEIAPERASLEQLFVELTGGEPAAAEAAT